MQMAGAIVQVSTPISCVVHFPLFSVEHEEDWKDRISITSSNTHAWRFPLLLLMDRSAAHRGAIRGSQTQRTAAEAWEYM